MSENTSLILTIATVYIAVLLTAIVIIVSFLAYELKKSINRANLILHEASAISHLIKDSSGLRDMVRVGRNIVSFFTSRKKNDRRKA